MIKSKLKIGIVVSEWYKDLYTKGMLENAVNAFKNKGIIIDKKNILWVPGSFELPLGASLLLKRGCDAVLVLGVVIRGKTSHYDHVCEACTIGVIKVQLEYKKPVIFGILTCENDKQVKARLKKVNDLVDACIKMCNICSK